MKFYQLISRVGFHLHQDMPMEQYSLSLDFIRLYMKLREGYRRGDSSN